MRSRILTAFIALVALAGLAAAPASAGALRTQRSAEAPRNDADHTEHYFPSSDGITQLHADVLRPKGMPVTEKTPVIVAVSPYTNHNGSTTDLDLNGTGPNPRFYDFLDMSGALTKGYTFVYVDLPGFGGSGGCNDWGGVREQGAVRAAVEWAASQPWSTGKVALLGKSYDGWTGLMGIATQPEGLAAVVALEPVYSGYRYIWMNGVRKTTNWPATIALFQAIDAKPGRPGDTPQYHANGAPQAWCYGVNIAGAAADDNHHGPYWQERDLLPTALGKTTPLFLTQGFLETNTLPDGAFQYWNGLAGRNNQAWFGQFDHARCWEKNNSLSTPSGNNTRWQTGRDGKICMDQIMRFLDEHLKGITPPIEDPTVTVQDITGRYRAEEAWPPADSHLYETALNTGSYADTGGNNGANPGESGLWTVSPPLEHDVWLAGEPIITAGVDAVPNANFAANVYDIDETGKARMISRGVSIIRGTGTRTVSYSMFGQDWPIPAGHRVGVRISAGDTGLGWLHVPTGANVTVRNAKIGLPFLTYDRTEFLELDARNPRLDSYMSAGATTLSAAKLASSERPFVTPGPLAPRPE